MAFAGERVWKLAYARYEPVCPIPEQPTEIKLPASRASLLSRMRRPERLVRVLQICRKCDEQVLRCARCPSEETRLLSCNQQFCSKWRAVREAPFLFELEICREGPEGSYAWEFSCRPLADGWSDMEGRPVVVVPTRWRPWRIHSHESQLKSAGAAIIVPQDCRLRMKYDG